MASKQTVVVTGGAGYVGSHITKILLEQGFRVHVTVSNIADTASYEHLNHLVPNNKPEVTQADCTAEGCYDKAFKGADIVVHVATPFILGAPDPKKEIIDPAVEGTRSALNAAVKANIKKFVYMSSMAAMHGAVIEKGQPHVFDESSWNTIPADKDPYPYAKTEAEKVVWQFIKENNPKFQVVVLNPGIVIGPPLSKRSGTSVNLVAGCLMGAFAESGVPPIIVCPVDVRDLAQATLAAIRSDSASGRYILCHKRGATLLELMDPLRAKYSKNPLPTKPMVDFGEWPETNPAKAIAELGFNARPVAESMVDMAAAMESLGMIKNMA